MKTFLLLLLQLVVVTHAYKTVTLDVTPSELSPGASTVVVNVNIKNNDGELPPGFSFASWAGHNKWDFMGIWKEDSSHPEEKCTPKPGMGWECPSSGAYTTLSDYVFGSESLTRDLTTRKAIDAERELTFTSGSSMYHVYYCVTPWSFKALSYDCIARASFKVENERAERELSNALKRPLGEDKVRVTVTTPVPNRGRNPIVVDIRMTSSSFEAQSSQFVGVWKIHGDDIGCVPLDSSSNNDQAVYSCDKNEIYSDIVFNSPVKRESTYVSNWVRTPVLDHDAGYAALYCDTPFLGWLVMSPLRPNYRCYARSAMFVPSTSEPERTGRDVFDSISEAEDITTAWACHIPPPQESWWITEKAREGAGALGRGLSRVTSFGARLIPSEKKEKPTVDELKLAHFQPYENVMDIQGYIIGYNQIRITDLSGRARIKFKNSAMRVNLFSDGHDHPNLVDESRDCRKGHTSATTIGLNLVDWKVMSIDNPSKTAGSKTANIKIEAAISLKATYNTVRDLDRDESFFSTLQGRGHSTSTTETEWEKNDIAWVELPDHPDTKFRCQIVKVLDSGRKFKVKFSNKVTKEVPKSALSRVESTAWQIRTEDIKVCIADLEFEIHSSGRGDSGSSMMNHGIHAISRGASLLGTRGRKALIDKFATDEIKRILYCSISSTMDESAIGNHLSVLARAASYHKQMLTAMQHCILHVNKRPECQAFKSEEALAQRLAKIRQGGDHDFALDVRLTLDDVGTENEHLSMRLDTDLDTSSSGLIRMLVQPVLNVIEKTSAAPTPRTGDGEEELRFLASQNHIKNTNRIRQRQLRRNGDEDEDAVNALVGMVTSDIHNLASEAASANRHLHAIVETVGDFLMSSATDLYFTLRGGVKVNPPRDQSSATAAKATRSLCVEPACVPKITIDASTLETRLFVPKDSKISVPFRWAILDQPFADWHLDDIRLEPFEYYGDVGATFEDFEFEGPITSALEVAKLQNVSSALIESGMDMLLDHGAGIVIHTKGEKGIHLDKDFLNVHMNVLFVGPSNLAEIVRWAVDQFVQTKRMANEWAKEVLESRNDESRPSIASLARGLSSRSAISSSFLEESEGVQKFKSPCNRKVGKMDSLPDLEACMMCVETFETPKTWDRNWPAKDVTYTGCYWNNNNKKCSMVSTQRDVPPRKGSATTRDACETLFSTETVRESRRRDDVATYNAKAVSKAIKLSRSIAMKTIRNDKTHRGSGDRCVAAVRDKVRVPELDSNVLISIVKASCVRAVATQIAIDSGHKMGFEVPKKVVKVSKNRERYPSGNIDTPLRFGPRLSAKKYDDVLDQFLKDWLAFEIEGMGPLCGDPSATRDTRHSGEEKCTNLWTSEEGQTKFWSNMFGFMFSKPFLQLKLCKRTIQFPSGTNIRVNFILEETKSREKATKQSRPDATYKVTLTPALRGLQTRDDVVDIPDIEITLRKRGSSESKTYYLRVSNPDDYTTLETIFSFDLSNLLESSSPAIHEDGSEIRDSIIAALSDDNRPVDQWYASHGMKKYPLMWASAVNIPWVGKIAVGAMSVELNEADVGIELELDEASGDIGRRLHVLIGAKTSATNFQEAVARIDLCDPKAANDEFFALKITARDGKFASTKIPDIMIGGFSMLIRGGAYFVLEWDTSKSKWIMRNQDTKFCIPNNRDYFKMDTAIKSGILASAIQWNLVYDNIVDTVVPLFRSILFCNVEKYLLGAEDHLARDTFRAQVKATPTLAARLLAAMTKGDIDDVSPDIDVGISLLLKDQGTSTEKLILDIDESILLSTRSLFTALIEYSNGEESAVVSPDAVAEFASHWAEKLDTQNDGVLPELANILGSFFTSEGANLRLNTDLKIDAKMYQNLDTLDTLSILSRQFTIRGNARNDIPARVATLLNLARLANEVLGIDEHQPDPDGFTMNIGNFTLGAMPMYLHGPILGTLMSLESSMCGLVEEDLDISCLVLKSFTTYLKSSEVELLLIFNGDDPGTGLFMDRVSTGSNLEGRFEGETDITSVLKFLIDVFLVDQRRVGE